MYGYGWKMSNPKPKKAEDDMPIGTGDRTERCASFWASQTRVSGEEDGGRVRSRGGREPTQAVVHACSICPLSTSYRCRCSGRQSKWRVRTRRVDHRETRKEQEHTWAWPQRSQVVNSRKQGLAHVQRHGERVVALPQG